MKNAFITQRMMFCAAHRLHSDKLSDAENRKVFGKCNYQNGHGHNYVVEVTVFGPIDPRTSMVMNLFDLHRIMTDTIEQELDHKNLNLDVPSFQNLNPTAENIAQVIWNMLEPKIPQGLLYEIRLGETENNFVSYRG